MASDGLGVLPVQSEEQGIDDGTHSTDTPSLKTGVPDEPDSGRDTSEVTADSAGRDEDGVDVCQFFLMGKCRFGLRCRLSHSNPSMDDSGAVFPDHDDKRHGEKMEKHKKKANKATKPKYETKEVNKKPRMRTADDVISRILWDPSVDASEFVVGYVDRFLGVLERPFNEFNWDTSPCDCDYSSELALPRHRIQYFLYRGHRVWDRHTRTDKVFGSTGQSLAPPFGGEEEVTEGNVEEQQELKTTEEQPLVVCGKEESETEESNHAEDTHLEEETLSDSTQPAPDTSTQQAASRPDQTSSPQKDGASEREETDEEPLAEWQESWEASEDAPQGGLHVGHSCSPLQQREDKRGGRPPKKRPTHFITFRANTPAILSCFRQLQEEITSLLPSSAPHWQTSSCLHVTLCLLVLPGPAEVAAAADALRHFAQLDRNPPVAVTFPVRPKHFGGKVLYLSPQPQLHLQQLNSGLQEVYRVKGLLHRDSYNPRYHLTLAKVVTVEDRVFERVGDLKVGKGLNFGRLPVNTLHLCPVGGLKVDGFYETVCTVSLR